MAYCIFLPNKKLLKTFYFLTFLNLIHFSKTVYTWFTLKRYKFIHVVPMCSQSQKNNQPNRFKRLANQREHTYKHAYFTD